MSVLTGLTANTKKNIQLDAGVLYKNWVIGTDTPATATAKLIGATEGGATLAIVPEVRQITVDGAKGPTKDLETIDGVTATLSASIKEVTADVVKLALGAATITSATPTGYSKVTMDNDFDSADYLTNIAWLGKISGATDPCVIILKNALNLNGFNFTVKDKGEGIVPVVMTAHYDISSLDDIPVEIYVPVVS